MNLREQIRTWLLEDVGHGDLTTQLTVPQDAQGQGVILAKEAGVLAGIEAARLVFHEVDPTLRFTALKADGDRLEPVQAVARIEGRLASILTAERLALNLLQRLSGIATLTRKYVEAVAGTQARILDTRKTTPGLRALEKYAVRVGGGHNHRFGLFDGILIKDNHIAAAGGVRAAVTRARARAPHGLRVEVEVTTLAELEEALEAGADVILLDNMDLPTLRQAVARTAGRARLEASGGMTLERVRAVAETGVDFISVGALTHSAKALDLSLEIEATPAGTPLG
ncbi:carboxylating nicotinate-nucleotide diphosphorylase [Marinithermus hydrothermalis]|uniref:Probable nicotinate-nucleotide pyrophosphorylase [carboxylating] n=1 Tax=Marinithermus hydrothermalis (strain DSM 14884 / JCM 11576 / T1) TaxID=869210 RepID=F2NN76_MARHT|nr:carboxylating nicotinate-nucleotide diphosphorylase [Marinithermus hydrothermalis]AEB12815.1 nicotinate-nucleotide pyrophosphorylase [Marinithermus hydrothermalis DSM 14884]